MRLHWWSSPTLGSVVAFVVFLVVFYTRLFLIPTRREVKRETPDPKPFKTIKGGGGNVMTPEALVIVLLVIYCIVGTVVLLLISKVLAKHDGVANRIAAGLPIGLATALGLVVKV